MVDLSSPTLMRQSFVYSESGGDNTPTGGGGNGEVVVDRVNDALNIFDRIRCVANPSARGCYEPDPVIIQQQQDQGQRTMLMMIGGGVLLLLLVVILVIAFKK